MAIVLDQPTVFNEFTTVIPAEIKTVLLPHIVGPQAELHRYSDPTEKAGINVGPYIPGLATSYAWPDKGAGSLVDLSFVQIFIDSALLRYFQRLEGADANLITAVGGFQNRIIRNIDTTHGFKANGNTYPRIAALNDRDVQIGDVVMLRHNTTTFFSTVSALIPDVVAASIAAATADAANAGNQIASTNATQTAGTVNDVAATADGTAYNGLATGDINEIYTITVTQGSTGGNATTALVSVVSASGRDNQASVAPAAFGAPTSIGTRGLTVTWTHTADDLLVGQVWTVTEHQAFTAPTATSGGTYTGTETTTYIVTVTLGGKYTDPTKPQISVVNALGTDASGPTTVPAGGTNVPVGTQGVQVQFNQTALRKGDKYYINVTGPSNGAYRTIQLNDNLPSALQAAGDMEIDLHIQKNIEVPQDRVSSPPTLNWTADQSGVVINSAVDAYDPTLTNGGVMYSVPVVSGPNTAVFISYRAWSTQWNNLVGKVQVPVTSDPKAAVQAVLGSVTPDNPLAYAVYKAVLNANAQTVSFSSVADPSSLNDWTFAAQVLVGLPISSITILTHDTAILNVFKTHVDAESQDNVGGWRDLWFVPQAVETIAIVDQALSTDGNVVLATLSDDPGTTGTQYTYLTVTSGNAKFITKGVQAGDSVRYLYSIDGFGNATFTTFTVAKVVNEDTLIFNLPGALAGVGVPQRVEVWRNLTPTSIATTLASQATGIHDAHVRFVWPDEVEDENGSVDGYFLAAALAGFTAGVAPHQGIQSIPITGFTGASKSTNFFGNGQLNILSNAGFFVVTQDGNGNVFTRNALTTDQSAPEVAQEVVVRNDGAIKHVLYNRVSQFFGIANVTDAGIVLVRSELQGGLQQLQSFTFINRLGNMIISGSIDDIRPSVVQPDELIVQITIQRPFPIDELQLNLIFVQATNG